MIDQLMQVGDVCLLVDKSWQVIEVSPQTDQSQAIVGQSIWDCLRDMDPPIARQQLLAAVAQRAGITWQACTPTRQPVTLQAFAHGAGMVLLIHAKAPLAPAESAAHAPEVEHRVQQLQRLVTGMIQAEQSGRRQLAESLHDDLQQLLAAAKLHVGIVRRHASGQARLLQAVNQLGQLLNDAIHASRSLEASLCPAILYEGSLAASLQWLVRHEHQRTGMVIDLQADPQAELSSDDARVMLFRAVQELLDHAGRVAHAQQVLLRVRPASDDVIEMVLEDQRPNQSPKQFQAWTCTDAFGLFSVGEKLKLLGGTMTIDASAKGVRVSLCVPRLMSLNRSAQPLELPPAVRLDIAPMVTDDQPAHTQPVRGPGYIRVMLADDHEIVRQGLASLLSDQPDMKVIAMAHDGQSAVQQARAARPDVIVMDLSMPVFSGIDATRQITAEMPHVQVIGLSMHDQNDMSIAMRQAGGWGYLRKGGPADAVVAAIRRAFAQRWRADSKP